MSETADHLSHITWFLIPSTELAMLSIQLIVYIDIECALHQKFTLVLRFQKQLTFHRSQKGM